MVSPEIENMLGFAGIMLFVFGLIIILGWFFFVGVALVENSLKIQALDMRYKEQLLQGKENEKVGSQTKIE